MKMKLERTSFDTNFLKNTFQNNSQNKTSAIEKIDKEHTSLSLNRKT